MEDHAIPLNRTVNRLKHSLSVQYQNSNTTLRQSSFGLFSEKSKGDLSEPDRIELINALSIYAFEEADGILSKRLDCHDENEHRARITETYSILVSRLLSAYDLIELHSRNYYRDIIYRLFIFSVDRGIEYTSHQHTELVVFMAPSSTKKAIAILAAVPQGLWSEQCHAIAYHLNWKNASDEVVAAEQFVITAATKSEYSGVDLYMEEISIEVKPRKNMVDRASPEIKNELQRILKEEHWLSLRSIFESLQKSTAIVHSIKSTQVALLSHGVQVTANTLLHSICVLALHFNESEFLWSCFEKSECRSEWWMLHLVIECCRQNINGTQMSIWVARAWVLYKSVLELEADKIMGSREYKSFMQQFARFVYESEPIETSSQMLLRIYHDMVLYCSPYYFSISDEAIQPLIESCWQLRDSSKSRWILQFQMILDIYDLFKHFKSTPRSRLEGLQLFKPETLVLLLKFCTATGELEVFRLLNQDVAKIEEFDDDYRMGYTAYISTRVSSDELAPLVIDVVQGINLEPEILQKLQEDLVKVL